MQSFTIEGFTFMYGTDIDDNVIYLSNPQIGPLMAGYNAFNPGVPLSGAETLAQALVDMYC